MASKRHINLELDNATLHSGKFKGLEDIELHFNSWKSKSEKPKAVLILVHGLGDHSGILLHGCDILGHYMTIVTHFIEKGYTIYGYDQRGHGLSPGARGHINKFDDLMQDLNKFVSFVYEQENLPLFLFGNSMGGAVTVYYSLKLANPLIKGTSLSKFNNK